ncbi:MAG: hypothetical protein M1127_03420 [Patescibacteria group bacterium]|nr:hypothetical protein [Patescibacteria group bacterium]
MRKFFLFVLILVIGVCAVGFWYWKTGAYSKEVLKLEILGPDTAQAGQEVEYSVKLKNNGKVRLEEPQMVFEYPKNSLVEGSKAQRVIQQLEAIYPGEERIISFKARLFSRENDPLEAKCLLTFKPKNLKASYQVNTSFITKISSVPITLEFDLPAKVEQSDNMKFSLNYFSNAETVLENLRAKIIYPPGFIFQSALPRALDENEWALPSVSQAEGGRVTVQGELGDSAPGQKNTFRAQLGIVLNGEFVLLKETSQTLETAEPSLYVSQLVNGAQNYKANVGDLLHYTIYFKNIGKAAIQKKFLLVKLDGDLFDISTLKSENGDIGNGDNSIIWDWKSEPSLQFLDVDEEGEVEFWVKVKSNSQARKIQNPILRDAVVIAGAEKTFEIKVNSQAELVQKAVFDDDYFGNAGPVPPQVASSTTYTIIWQIRNSWNNLKNVKIKAALPDNVRPSGKIFPENAKFTFDSTSREIVWLVGDLAAAQADVEQPVVPLAFQVELTPGQAQGGSMAPLVLNVEITGEDGFTGDIVSNTVKGVDVLVAIAPY